MKAWQRALGRIRLLGPDEEPFRADVKLVYEYIETLERRADRAVGVLAGAIEPDPLHTSVKGRTGVRS